MDGRAIGAAALSDAGLRRLTSEQGGPRPAGVAAREAPERGEALRPLADGGARATRP